MAEALPFKTAMQFTYGEPRELAPGVFRIVANNPSPFTYKGTNTYLLGSTSVALIDPAEHRPFGVIGLELVLDGERFQELGGL